MAAPAACRALCAALLIAALGGCHVILPLGPAEDDAGPCAPDLEAPLACSVGSFFGETFEQPALVPAGWQVKTQGTGYVTIHPKNIWFSPAQGDRFLMFDPQAGCCGVNCPPIPANNTLILTSPVFLAADCGTVTLTLEYALGHMEAGQDVLRVESSSDGESWTTLSNLEAATMYQWQSKAVEIPFASSGALQLRILHQSQCWNDNAAVDNLRLVGNSK